ncbi:MAG: formate dehydrogenase accessory protein FdhE [Phycisphaerae bacterium]|jgi:formate dehydrogenase maturation protein FdhE
MGGKATSSEDERTGVKALERRARAILKARPAYAEMVEFYLTVFRRQLEWRDRLMVHPEEVSSDQVQGLLREGKVLKEQYDPGLDSDSLMRLWSQMKADFAEGNEVLCEAVGKIEAAEARGDLVAATWLMEQRPERGDLITDASERIGVDASVLATLARSVTFPHWAFVSEAWVAESPHEVWKRPHCPVCGCIAGLVELRKEASGLENTTSVSRRYGHCPFCGTRWVLPSVSCLSCGSTKAGDAKYFFASEEPDLRIDFCNRCHHYVKVVDGGKMSGRIHVGLELLTASHLDVIARDKHLSPLEVSA